MAWFGYVGRVGAVYSTVMLTQGSGLFGSPPSPVSMFECGGITSIEGCTPGDLLLCLECGNDRGVQLCANG